MSPSRMWLRALVAFAVALPVACSSGEGSGGTLQISGSTTVNPVAAVVVPLLLVARVLGVLVVRGAAAWDPGFWLQPATGASGGGIRDQILGTLVLVLGTAVLAAPLGLGLLIAEYAGLARALALDPGCCSMNPPAHSMPPPGMWWKPSSPDWPTGAPSSWSPTTPRR